MSHSLLSDVWKVRSLKTNPKFVLFKIVDHYNDKTNNHIYPSISSLCEATGLGRTCVKECLATIEEKGFTTLVKDATPNFPKIWQLNVEFLKKEAELGSRHTIVTTENDEKQGVATRLSGSRHTTVRESPHDHKSLTKSLEESLEKEILRISKKDELPLDQSNFENSSPEQKSGSEVDRIACREESLDVGTPTPNSEEFNQEEKAVGTPTIPLKAEDAKTSKKFKGKGKVKKQDSLTEEQQAQFEEIWNIWPKKFEKKASKKYFAQALEAGIEFSVLLSQATAYIQHEKDKNGDTKYVQFVQYLRTWLSEERWTDVYPTSAKSPVDSEIIFESKEIERFIEKNPSLKHEAKNFAQLKVLDLGDKVELFHPDQQIAGKIDDFYRESLAGYFGKSVRMVKSLSMADKPSKHKEQSIVLPNPLRGGQDLNLEKVISPDEILQRMKTSGLEGIVNLTLKQARISNSPENEPLDYPLIFQTINDYIVRNSDGSGESNDNIPLEALNLNAYATNCHWG